MMNFLEIMSYFTIIEIGLEDCLSASMRLNYTSNEMGLEDCPLNKKRANDAWKQQVAPSANKCPADAGESAWCKWRTQLKGMARDQT